MNMTRKDELGDMSHQINTMLEPNCKQRFRTANESADLSSNISEVISRRPVKKRATSVNSQHACELLSTAMTEMSATISDVAMNARKHRCEVPTKWSITPNQNDENMQVTATTISPSI
ncbi:hypothetical protein OK016_18725 [Vibrio chagasii]|nr:hypothetical protein [Vibrio chagasii]